MGLKRTPQKKPPLGETPATSTRSTGIPVPEAVDIDDVIKGASKGKAKQVPKPTHRPNGEQQVSIMGGGGRKRPQSSFNVAPDNKRTTPAAQQNNSLPVHIQGAQDRVEAQQGTSGQNQVNKARATPTHSVADSSTWSSQGSSPAAGGAAPRTVVKAGAQRATLVQKAAAAGLHNASRVLVNRGRSTSGENAIEQNKSLNSTLTSIRTQAGTPSSKNEQGHVPTKERSPILARHNTRQEGPEREEGHNGPQRGQSLNFDPMLPMQEYTANSRRLFHTGLEGSIFEGNEPDGEIEDEVFQAQNDTLRPDEFQEMVATRYDSIAKIRKSIAALNGHVQQLEGILPKVDKAELIQVHQDLIRRITDHCLLRGHLFNAEGKLKQGRILLGLDFDLKHEAATILAKISDLRDPTDSVERSVSVGEIEKDLLAKARLQAREELDEQYRLTKNGFRNAKSSKKSRNGASSQDKFKEDLNRRSMSKQNLESTREEPKEKSYVQDGLQDYLARASRSYKDIPSSGNKRSTDYGREFGKTAFMAESFRYDGAREPEPTKTKPPPRYPSTKAPTYRTHSKTQEELEDEQYYLSLTKPWNIIPDQEGQSFNALMTMQKNGIIPTFEGEQAKYSNFRTLFFASVHTSKTKIFTKDILLRQALKNCTAMNNIIAAAPPGRQGYAMLIKRLEEKYGGSTKLLNHYLSRMNRMHRVHEGQIDQLEELLDVATGYHAALEAWGGQDSATHSHFNFILHKLESNLRMQYHTHLLQFPHNKECDVHHLIDWAHKYLLGTWRLEPAMHKRQAPDRRQDKPDKNQHQGRPPPDRPAPPEINRFRQQVPPGRHYQANRIEEAKCPACAQEHPLADCKKFAKMNDEDKMSMVVRGGRCFRCLEAGHRSRTCKAGIKCTKCGKHHHVTLHNHLAPKPQEPDLRGAGVQLKAFPAQAEAESESSQADSTKNSDNIPVDMHKLAAQLPKNSRINFFRCYQVESGGEIISLRFAVVNIINPENGKSATIAALLDEGANMTLLSERVSKELDLQGTRHGLGVLGVGGNLQQVQSLSTQIKIQAINESFAKTALIRTMPDPTGGLEMTRWQDHIAKWEHLKHLTLLEVPKGFKVDMIIGNDQPYLHRCFEEITHKVDLDAPVARLGPLGWSIAGRIEPKTNKKARVNKLTAYIYKIAEEQRKLPRLATPLVAKEQLGLEPMSGPERPPIINQEDRAALNTLQKLTYITDQKVTAPVIWRDNERPISNLQYALNHWKRSRNKLKQNSQLYKLYEEQIKTWLQKGYGRILPREEAEAQDVYYLPHFPVVRMDHVSTKLRIVMDGKAKFGQSKSLNDCILKGPKILNELVLVLTNFRKYKVAVAGDVKEMFLQVKLYEEDARYHRYVYTFEGMLDDQWVIIEATVHQFGNRGSPVTVVFVIKWKAYTMRYECPLAAQVILDGSIVDDCMGSQPTEELAQELVEQLKKVFNSCGMTIHKWASSSPRVVPNANMEERAIKEYSDEFPEGKALGLYWDPAKDVFRFKMDQEEPQIWTRLTALKFYMKLFDPLGLILPFIMSARFLFKESWNNSMNWDEPLVPRLQKAWSKWAAATKNLPLIRIPRWIRFEQLVEFHVFGDASYQGYGVVCYVVARDELGMLHSVLVFSKAKTVTSCAKTIPRAEMSSAHMAALTGVKWAKALGIDLTKVYYWSDSINALSWIKAPRRDLNQICARQSAQIREVTDPFHWQYVPTAENPADLVTRGLDPTKLAGSDLWWQGPRFLTTQDWPKPKVQAKPHEDLPNESELRRLVGIFHAHSGQNPVRPVTYTNNWAKTRRILAYAAAFIDALKGNKHAPYLEDGLDMWIKWSQGQHFANEREILLAGQRPKGQKWQQYDLAVQKGIIMLSGRTRREPRPLLAPNSHLAKCWTDHIHTCELKHAGGWKVLLNETRAWFWMFNATSLAKKINQDCVKCKRRMPMAKAQRMAPLPDCRMGNETKLAFEHIAIDFAGPWYVKIGKGHARQKRYVLVICCMTFRAMRAEITPDRETSSVLLALQNFSSRDRIPSTIRSDNGAELIRAAKELRQADRGNDKQDLLNPEWTKVEWSFSHPAAPHSNGVVESMVGVFKRAVTRVLDRATLTDFTLRTAATFAEDIANRRPMGTISSDPNDPTPLTPGMFLGHAQNKDYPIKPKTNKYNKIWADMNELKEELYQRFQKELIPELEKRQKWWDLVPEPEIDQFVICLECEPTIDGRWPLGRVVELLHGHDGVVRAVWVWVNGKMLKRHLRHIVPLL